MCSVEVGSFMLVGSEIWEEARPWIQLQRYLREGGSDNPRIRIEVSNDAPFALLRRLVATEMPCVACGEAMHPFRSRKPKGDKRGGTPQHLYYAAACPLKVNIGCSRGRAASDEYEHIVSSLKLQRSDELFPAFVKHMVESDDWEMETVLYCLEKPWKWTEEFISFVRGFTPR